MSSPLSTLKKLKRTPLQRWEKPKNHPSRNLLREFQEEARGSSFSDSHTPHNIRMEQNKSTNPEPSVTQQLLLLEQRVRAQAEEIQLKDKKISDLKEALRINKDIFKRRYMMLQQQVFEMESFLLDYNMIWVGSETTDAKEQTYNLKGLWTPPETSPDKRFYVNFDLILEKIQELNILAGKGETYIQTTTTGAQLARKEHIELWLYRNGIMMFDGPFRTYQEQKTQQFVQDLTDGYFPSELQERFPDGVPFQVHDRREEQFTPKQQKKMFHGHGHVIQAVIAAPDSGKQMGQAMKAGQVMMIGEELEKALQVPRSKQVSSNIPSSGSVSFVDTPALQRSDCQGSDVTTLKIRSEDGGHTYMLKMIFSETIAHVRQYLDKHRGDRVPSYDIISYPPRCCYDDNNKTIQACGLTANSSLLLRTRPASN